MTEAREEQTMLMEKVDIYLEPMLTEYLQLKPVDAVDYR